MARSLLILIAIGCVWLLLRRGLAAAYNKHQKKSESHFAPTIRCRQCGAYVDRRLARPDGDGYCCQAHDIRSG